jgi:DNA mismatch repair protein MutS
MMQQHREAKERHPGMLLLFRAGDFYELFYEDAEVVARVLNIALTTRDGKIPMAGFPHHSLEPHLRKLLRAGHRAAICEQVEDAAQAKGRLIRREVTRVVTPGTLTDEALLEARASNYIAAIVPPPRGKGPAGLAWAELSTGAFHAADVPAERLADELLRIAPAELLAGEMASSAEAAPLFSYLREALPTLTITPRPDWAFDPDTARNLLLGHFQVSTLSGFGFDASQPCLTAAGAVLAYLQETMKSTLPHLRGIRPYVQSGHLQMDEATRRGLEVVRSSRDGSRSGSLLGAVDRTVSAMGARLLQEWLLSPLAEATAINARLEAVGELAEAHSTRSEVRQLLGRAPDLQRLTSRACTGRAGPRDLGAVARALALLPDLQAALASFRSPLLAELAGRLDPCADLRKLLEAALSDELPLTAREGGVIRRGFDAALDELHHARSTAKEWIARYQAEQQRRTGIGSLKVGYNEVFGYYIEVTNAHQARVPSDYTRKQTLKGCERYTTPELKEQEEKVLTAAERISQLEQDLFGKLRDATAERTGRLLATAEACAALDALASFAELASERGYCRPEVTDEPVLELRAARHPVLEQSLPPGTFVPNDLSMGPEDGMFLLVTGPNMGGKSVYMRQAALALLLAQAGSFVPAESARIGLADRLFTRVGASDDIANARSTFMVEMTEAANILNNATSRSFVILDEVGRGTSTYDGVALAWGVTEHLHDVLQCRTLFATHYHELSELVHRLPRLRNLNVMIHESGGEIVFLHRVAPGSSTRSYGLHVARKAGLPEKALARAAEVLAELEARHAAQPARPGGLISRPRLTQASLFAGTDDPVLVALRELDVGSLTPEELVEQVRRWQRELGG